MIPDEIGKRLGPETRKSDAWSDWLRRRSKLNLVFCSGFLVKKCETTTTIFISKRNSIKLSDSKRQSLFQIN